MSSKHGDRVRLWDTNLALIAELVKRYPVKPSLSAIVNSALAKGLEVMKREGSRTKT